MIDIYTLPNPYDHSHPVSEEGLFFGRKEELNEIKYYLDQAKINRPVSIALMGARASGKTSLLNIAEKEAEKRNFCTVRIDLDEGKVLNQLGFFYEIFDGVISAVCRNGGFGGMTGKTYQGYLKTVSTYKLPDDLTFSFLFPLQYAQSKAVGNLDVPLQENNFKQDLNKIKNEINNPIILLFDEGNVLGKSKILLEKLRNIFMNLPGFMIIITGTPDLFPVMDEVFSPIIRQFHKIKIEGFKTIEETKECIQKPLDKIGLDPYEIFDLDEQEKIREIHDLADGKPYEVQLICHTLFKRIQQKRDNKMRFSPPVLDEILNEMATSQTITTRPILGKIKKLRKKQFEALYVLCACEEALFNQLWAVEHTFWGKFTEETLTNELQFFLKEGIIRQEGNAYKFSGDEFDKIYAKYCAHERGSVQLSFPDFTFEDFCFFELRKFLSNHIENLTFLEYQVILGTMQRSEEIKDADIDKDGKLEEFKEAVKKDPFAAFPELFSEFYDLAVQFRTKEKILLIRLSLKTQWFEKSQFSYSKKTDSIQVFEKIKSAIEIIKNRAQEVNFQITAEKMELKIPDLEALANDIAKTSNEKVRNLIAEQHAKEARDIYLVESNLDDAIFHAKLSNRYNSKPDPDTSNNLGYIFMIGGDSTTSKDLLEKSIIGYKNPEEKALAYYNLGILHAKQSNNDKALECLNQCILTARARSPRDRKCACLIRLGIENGKLNFTEDKNRPDLYNCAIEAKQTIENFAGT